MTKTNNQAIQHAGVGILLSLMYQNAMANDASPLFPNFVLEPYQILSTTNITYQKVDFDKVYYVNSAGLLRSADMEIIDKSVGQSIRLGLHDYYEIGLSESYSDIQSNLPQVVDGTSGFSNPTISAKKNWGAHSDVLFNTHISATPKTGDSVLRNTPTTYNIGIATAINTPKGYVATIGLNRTMVNNLGDANSTSIQAGIYKELGLYTINVSGAINLLKNDSHMSFSTGLGRQVTSNTWLLASYVHTNALYTSNALSVSLRALF